jgi:hypothetical protein
MPAALLGFGGTSIDSSTHAASSRLVYRSGASISPGRTNRGEDDPPLTYRSIRMLVLWG